MRRNARWVVLLAGAGAVLGTAMAQNNNAAAQARAAAASPEVIAAGVEITNAHGQPISSSVSPL